MFYGVDDLPRVRRWLRLSTQELATRAGIKPGVLSKIESGRRVLSSDNRRRLSQALAARRAKLTREGKACDAQETERRAAHAAA